MGGRWEGPKPESAASMAVRVLTFSVLIALTAPTTGVAQERSEADPALLAAFLAGVEDGRDEVIRARRDIHRHPEPSGSEERTAALVTERLRAAGFEVRTGIGGHGVVGLLVGDPSGPLLAFRADMDAVRDGADDPMAFASVVPGVNHICGHDIHTAIGLALAEGFAAVRDRLPGSVLLIFQPAEETARGARAMIRDGAIAEPRPDAIFAVHTAPYEVGQLATAADVLMPGRDLVRVYVEAGGMSVARSVGDLLRGVGTIPADQARRPVQGEFVVVRGVRSGAAERGRWTISATLTTSSAAASGEARAAIERGLEALRVEGARVELDYRERWIEGVVNEPALVSATNASIARALGDDALRSVTAMIPLFSEDFGSFQREVPGVMYFLGVSNLERGWVGMPHTARYAADEAAIFVAARAFGAVFFDLFAGGVPPSRRAH